MIEAAEAAAAGTLPTPAVTPTRYGVGFLGIHDGRGSNLVFVDWWEQENELHHHVFFSKVWLKENCRVALLGLVYP